MRGQSQKNQGMDLDLDLTDLNGLLELSRTEEYETISRGILFVSDESLRAFVVKGGNYFHEVTGIQLPHDIDYHGIRSNLEEGVYLPLEEAKKEIEKFRHFGGWLKKAAHLSGIREMAKNTQHFQGVFADETTCDLWEVAKKYPNPEDLDTLLKQVYTQVESLECSPKIRWTYIASALLCTNDVKDAVVIATAGILGMKTQGYWSSEKKEMVRPSRQEAEDWISAHS